MLHACKYGTCACIRMYFLHLQTSKSCSLSEVSDDQKLVDNSEVSVLSTVMPYFVPGHLSTDDESQNSYLYWGNQ